MEDSIYIQIQANMPQSATLYEMQNGKPKLIPFTSKRLPEAAQNYSITKLKMCGLAY